MLVNKLTALSLKFCEDSEIHQLFQSIKKCHSITLSLKIGYLTNIDRKKNCKKI